jgi:hypothetical protein
MEVLLALILLIAVVAFIAFLDRSPGEDSSHIRYEQASKASREQNDLISKN